MRQVGVGNSLSALTSGVWIDFWTFFAKPLSLEEELSMRVVSPFTRTKLFIWTPTPPGGVASRTWSLRRNNGDVVTLTMTGAEQEIRWTGSVAFAAGDIESLQYTESGGPAATAYYHVGWEIDTVDDFASLYSAPRFELQQFAPRYIGPLTSTYGTTDINLGTDIMAMAGTIEGVTVTVNPAIIEGQWRFRWFVNGVKQDGSGATVDTTVLLTQPTSGLGAATGSFALPVVAGDIVSVQVTHIEGASIGWATYSTLFRGSIPHQSMFPSAQSQLGADNRYSPIRSASHPAALWEVTDSASAQSRTFDMAFTLSDFWSWASVAPGVGNTRTMRVRVNGIDTLLSVAQTGTPQVFSDLVNTADVPVESALNLHGLLTSSPAAATLAVNMIEDTTPAPVLPSFDTTTRTIRRMRRAPRLTAEHLWQFFHKFELFLQTGVGKTTGQGSDPQVMLRWSFDGGKTWSNEHWTTAGALGAYNTRAIWRRLGRGRDAVFEVTVSDPVFWALVDCYIDVEGGLS